MSDTAIVSEQRPRHALPRRIWRWTILTHRYLGIGLGLLVLAWCMSGIVMMYVPYPSLTASEQLAGLEPLDLGECCSAPSGADRLTAITDHRVEMLAGRPVLRVTQANSVPAVFDLASDWLEPDDALIRRAGLDYGQLRGFPTPHFVDRVVRDQWTVQSQFNPHRPMHRFTDATGREWYVSARTLEVVQLTSTPERFWNWIGAVVHWLYPTVLRQHVTAWSETVIWLTVVALFLTITGIVIGIRQYRTRGNGRRSPYRGWMLGHHYLGLTFGVLTLTWLFSGLLSMNPWGWLDGRSFERETTILNGGTTTLGDAVARVQALIPHLPPGAVRLTSAPWLGEPHYVAYDAGGAPTRFGMLGVEPLLQITDARTAALRIRPGSTPEVSLLAEADTYYYPHHHQPTELPVLRIRYPDGDRLYVSPVSGELLRAVDSSRRASRWLFAALHRGDFSALVRARPVWDVMMLLAMLGVTAGAGTGAWLGLRRLTNRRSAPNRQKGDL